MWGLAAPGLALVQKPVAGTLLAVEGGLVWAP